MIIRGIGIDIKVTKLLVSKFFYDLMANNPNENTKFVNGIMYYNGYVVEVDEEVVDLKFVCEYSLDMGGENVSDSIQAQA